MHILCNQERRFKWFPFPKKVENMHENVYEGKWVGGQSWKKFDYIVDKRSLTNRYVINDCKKNIRIV